MMNEWFDNRRHVMMRRQIMNLGFCVNRWSVDNLRLVVVISLVMMLMAGLAIVNGLLVDDPGLADVVAGSVVSLVNIVLVVVLVLHRVVRGRVRKVWLLVMGLCG